MTHFWAQTIPLKKTNMQSGTLKSLDQGTSLLLHLRITRRTQFTQAELRLQAVRVAGHSVSHSGPSRQSWRASSMTMIKRRAFATGM